MKNYNNISAAWSLPLQNWKGRVPASKLLSLGPNRGSCLRRLTAPRPIGALGYANPLFVACGAKARGLTWAGIGFLASATTPSLAQGNAFLVNGPSEGIRSFATFNKGSAVSSTLTSSARALAQAIKSLIGRPLNPHTLLHSNTKTVVYGFNKVNKLNPQFIAASTENLLKSIFLSMFSLISRPVFVIKHDKIIIRLFVFLSPKIDKYLDTSTYFAGGAEALPGSCPMSAPRLDTSTPAGANNSTKQVPLAKQAGLGLQPTTGSESASRITKGYKTTKQVGIPSANLKRLFRKAVPPGFASQVKNIRLNKFLKFKSLRAKPVEILKSQIKLQLLAGQATTPGLVLGSLGANAPSHQLKVSALAAPIRDAGYGYQGEPSAQAKCQASQALTPPSPSQIFGGVGQLRMLEGKGTLARLDGGLGPAAAKPTNIYPYTS